MAEETKLQVNVDFTNFPDLYNELEDMVAEDTEGNRSAFIRKLVREETARRRIAAQLEAALDQHAAKKAKRHSATVPA
jgi:Arc/MetJ-type ribon-helix-helix transcriptional regulator